MNARLPPAAAMLGLALLAGSTACNRGGLELADLERVDLAPGVELLRARVRRGDAPAGMLTVVYADPRRVRARIHTNPDHRPLAQLAPGALVVANAAFFTPEWQATGLLVSEGQVVSRFVKRAGSGVLVVEDGVVHLLERDAVGGRSFGRSALAIQAGPRIIEPDGTPGIRSDDRQRAHRTVVGADRRGRLALAVVLGPSGWSSGPSLYELQHLLGQAGLGRGAPELSFSFALNLDGGPSTGLHVRHPDHPVDLPEASPVHNALALELLP